MTVELAGLVAALGCLGFGHALLALVASADGSVWAARGRLEWGVTALALGVVLLPGLVFLGTLAFGPLPAAAGDGLLGLGIVAGLALVRRLPAARATRPWAGLERVLLVALVGLAVVALISSSAAPVHLFDPVFHFAYKGKILMHEGLASGAFSDLDGVVGRVMTHPSYPPLVPSLEVLASFPLGAFDASAGRVLWVLFAVAPAVWIAGALEGRGRRAQLVGALLWLSLPIIYYYRLPHAELGKAAAGLLLGPDGAGALLGGAGWRTTDGASLDAGGDLVVAALLCGAVVFLARPRRGAGDGVVAGVLLGGAVLAKNEGLALAAVLVVALGMRWLLARGRGLPGLAVRSVAVAFGAALVVTAPWLWYRGRIPAIDESYPALMRPAHVLAAMGTERLRAGEAELAPVTVAREYLLTFGDVLHWNLIWPLFFVALGAALLRPVRALERGALVPLLVAAGGLAAFFLILVVTPWHLGRLFTTGIPDRLFLQVAPLAAWGIAAWVFEPGSDGATDAAADGRSAELGA